MYLMVKDSNGDVISRELADFNPLDMSIEAKEDSFVLKINSSYELCERFSSKEAAIEKMDEITRVANNY